MHVYICLFASLLGPTTYHECIQIFTKVGRPWLHTQFTFAYQESVNSYCQTVVSV